MSRSANPYDNASCEGFLKTLKREEIYAHAYRDFVHLCTNLEFTNEGEMIMKGTTDVKDPVCGLDITPATAAGRTEHKGQTYYFCGSKCKEKFDLNPEQYLGKSA